MVDDTLGVAGDPETAARSGKTNPTSPPGWVLPVLWAVLGLVLLSLVVVAGFSLFKMDFFTRGALTDEEIKSLWAFVGVSLGAAVTLIGTLLTEQHNRATEALAHESAMREAREMAHANTIREQAEQRLTLDSVAKVLELIPDDQERVQSARNNGALSTLVGLERGSIALRILGDLWAANAVDAATAVQLIERSLGSDRRGEHEDAAALLAANASKLVPAKDAENQQSYNCPSQMTDWPSALSPGARNSLLVAAVKVLLAREYAFWSNAGDLWPIDLLYRALDDAELGGGAAHVVLALLESGALSDLDRLPDAAEEERVRALAQDFSPAPWFSKRLAEIGPWFRGEDASGPHEGVPLTWNSSNQGAAVGSTANNM